MAFPLSTEVIDNIIGDLQQGHTKRFKEVFLVKAADGFCCLACCATIPASSVDIHIRRKHKGFKDTLIATNTTCYVCISQITTSAENEIPMHTHCNGHAHMNVVSRRRDFKWSPDALSVYSPNNRAPMSAKAFPVLVEGYDDYISEYTVMVGESACKIMSNNESAARNGDSKPKDRIRIGYNAIIHGRNQGKGRGHVISGMCDWHFKVFNDLDQSTFVDGVKPIENTKACRACRVLGSTGQPSQDWSISMEIVADATADWKTLNLYDPAAYCLPSFGPSADVEKKTEKTIDQLSVSELERLLQQKKEAIRRNAKATAPAEQDDEEEEAQEEQEDDIDDATSFLN